MITPAKIDELKYMLLNGEKIEVIKNELKNENLTEDEINELLSAIKYEVHFLKFYNLGSNAPQLLTKPIIQSKLLGPMILASFPVLSIIMAILVPLISWFIWLPTIIIYAIVIWGHHKIKQFSNKHHKVKLKKDEKVLGIIPFFIYHKAQIFNALLTGKLGENLIVPTDRRLIILAVPVPNESTIWSRSFGEYHELNVEISANDFIQKKGMEEMIKEFSKFDILYQDINDIKIKDIGELKSMKLKTKNFTYDFRFIRRINLIKLRYILNKFKETTY